MGGCLITESIVILRWLEKMGFGPFALTGLSLGGYVSKLKINQYFLKSVYIKFYFHFSDGLFVFDGLAEADRSNSMLELDNCL